MSSNNGWQKRKLGNCAELIRDHFTPNEKNIQPYIGLEHIQEQTLRLSSVGKSTDVVSGKYIFKSGDILFGKLRPYFRKVVRPKFDGICSTDIWVIRAKDGTDQVFLYYLMASEEMVAYATKGSEGTKMPRAKWDFVENKEINYPPLSEQQRLASILGTLDDKIELNYQMNKTLEEMAQAIFKSWFVDFEPFQDGEFEYNDELDKEIPRGWEVRELGEIGRVVTGGTPSTKKSEYYGDDYPFIKIPDMRDNVFAFQTASRISKLGAEDKKKKMLPPLSVCVSCIATPGLVSLTSTTSLTNQQINSIICNKGISPYFVFLMMKYISHQIVSGGSGGTATLNLNKGDFSKIKVILPDKKIIQEFNDLVEPIFYKILDNQKESQTLSQIRDALLPKLLSGEIRVNIDKDTEVTT